VAEFSVIFFLGMVCGWFSVGLLNAYTRKKRRELIAQRVREVNEDLLHFQCSPNSSMSIEVEVEDEEP
jgi:hypothetical protein